MLCKSSSCNYWRVDFGLSIYRDPELSWDQKGFFFFLVCHLYRASGNGINDWKLNTIQLLWHQEEHLIGRAPTGGSSHNLRWNAQTFSEWWNCIIFAEAFESWRSAIVTRLGKKRARSIDGDPSRKVQSRRYCVCVVVSCKTRLRELLFPDDDCIITDGRGHKKGDDG
jgi:hypothetical protein